MKISAKRAVIRTCSASVAAVMCAALVLAGAPLKPAYAAGNATTRSYQEKISALEQQQKELKNKIKNIESEAAATLENKQQLDILVTTVNTKIQTAESLVSELTAQISETEEAIAEDEELIADTTEKVKERMRQNHEDGTANYLDVLMGSVGVGDFLSRLERINTMIEYDRKTLEDFRNEKADLEEKMADLEESKKLQEATLETLKEDKKDAEYLANKAASYFDSLQKDKSAAEAEYKKAAAAEDALNAQLEEMLRQLAAQQSSPVVSNGEFMWPLPSGGYISCSFGGSDPGGRPHYAVDCAISAGTAIYAANDGTVVTATSHSSYGNYIVLDHGGGRSTLYAHCSALAVSAGQHVSKGQVIGYVGSTGYSTGSHLHLEFRVNGVKQNPMNYISR